MYAGFFVAALAINLIRDIILKWFPQYIPIPMAMTVPFYIGVFGSSLIAMDEKTYELIGSDYHCNRAEDLKNPGLGWMIGFMFVSFLGLFRLVPLRKVMVLDYKLTYPSGTATAMLINSFHTKTAVELAGNQVRQLGKYLSISFFWSCFKWFFRGIGDSCGFDSFPSVGLTLFKNMLTDWSLASTYGKIGLFIIAASVGPNGV